MNRRTFLQALAALFVPIPSVELVYYIRSDGEIVRIAP